MQGSSEAISSSHLKFPFQKQYKMLSSKTQIDNSKPQTLNKASQSQTK
jgi:hypothetical protein